MHWKPLKPLKFISFYYFYCFHVFEPRSEQRHREMALYFASIISTRFDSQMRTVTWPVDEWYCLLPRLNYLYYTKIFENRVWMQLTPTQYCLLWKWKEKERVWDKIVPKSHYFCLRWMHKTFIHFDAKLNDWTSAKHLSVRFCVHFWFYWNKGNKKKCS